MKNEDKKKQLLKEIAEVIVYPGTVEDLAIVDPYFATFNVKFINVRARFELSWTKELNFEVWRLGSSNVLIEVSSSKWFKIGRIIDRDYSNADRLKNSPEYAF